MYPEQGVSMTDSPDRRLVLQLLSSAALISLVACEEEPAISTDSDVSIVGDVDETAWASGGTAAITGSYPDPFTTAATTCALVATTTEGPCTTTSSQTRQDVSEGWEGLPVRLMLKIVDSSCNALSGVTVRVWHTNFEGSYSGQTPNNNMCLTEQDYSSQDFFRGSQTTDSDGVVTFDTCFPGWYASRAVHIHLQVEGTAITQVFFPETITAGVFANHPDYEGYGQPDTTFANDNILANVSDVQRHVLEVSQASDGVMLASKVVTVS